MLEYLYNSLVSFRKVFSRHKKLADFYRYRSWVYWLQ